MHHTNYTTPQLQLHYIATTAALHHTQFISCGWGDHCNHCNHFNKQNSNHLSVNQWIRSAIRASQQPTSPIGFLFWNFRHRLVWYYWKDIFLPRISIISTFSTFSTLDFVLELPSCDSSELLREAWATVSEVHRDTLSKKFPGTIAVVD